jgi:hypothetical protein
MAGVIRSSGGAWTKLSRSMSSGPATNLIVDTVPLASFRSLDYIITVSNVAQDKTKRIHLAIVCENASLKSSVYGKLGSLKFAVTEAIVGGNCELTITNNESFAIEIHVAKLVLR